MGYLATADQIRLKFTGQQKDGSTTGLDFFNARYLSGAQGRFTSADPANAGASLGDPQTWNGYAYVNNNPLNLTDPSGEGILGNILGLVGSFFGPWGSAIGFGIGNAIDGAIWGPGAIGIYGGPTLGTFGIGGGSNGPWNEKAPISGRVGGGLNTGSVYGSGSTGGAIFSFEEQGRYLNGRLLLPNGDVAIWGIGGGRGGAVLKAAGKRATHDMGCVGLGFAVGGAGAAAVSTSLPTIDKPFSQGGMPKTSAASELFRDWTQGARGGRRLPAFEGGPFTGRPLKYRPTNSVGGTWARWLGPVGWIFTGVAAYQMNSCLSQ